MGAEFCARSRGQRASIVAGCSTHIHKPPETGYNKQQPLVASHTNVGHGIVED